MYKLLIEDFAGNVDEEEFGLNVVDAYNTAVIRSKFGNTDYVILTQNNLPVMKFVDGEEVKEKKR